MKVKLSLMPVFGIVFVDLLGFGMIIPLIALYGHHYQATALELAVLGSCYSFLQFLFSPVWGSLSDRLGRRPILLMSLCGSTVSYLVFGLATNYFMLLVSRAFAGLFAANISTAHAYAADSTSGVERIKAMGLIGAAVGLGFTLGPPLGGISVKFLGLSAPGFIASGICLLNLIACYFVLPESLSPAQAREPETKRPLGILGIRRFRELTGNPLLLYLVVIYSVCILAFSHMEQAFSLFLQFRLQLSTADAGYQVGLVLLFIGVVGVIIQGGLIKRLALRFGERRLLLVGMCISASAMAVMASVSSLSGFYASSLFIAIGAALIQPSATSLISQHSDPASQGKIFGITQSMASLARVIGPFSGLYAFSILPPLPFLVAAFLYSLVFVFSVWCFLTLARPANAPVPTEEPVAPTV